jgi:hypothetical protein
MHVPQIQRWIEPSENAGLKVLQRVTGRKRMDCDRQVIADPPADRPLPIPRQLHRSNKVELKGVSQQSGEGTAKRRAVDRAIDVIVGYAIP